MSARPELARRDVTASLTSLLDRLRATAEQGVSTWRLDELLHDELVDLLADDCEHVRSVVRQLASDRCRAARESRDRLNEALLLRQADRRAAIDDAIFLAVEATTRGRMVPVV